MAGGARDGGEANVKVGHGARDAHEPRRARSPAGPEKRIGDAANDGPRRKSPREAAAVGASLTDNACALPRSLRESPLRSFKHGYSRLDSQGHVSALKARSSSIARFRDPN